MQNKKIEFIKITEKTCTSSSGFGTCVGLSRQRILQLVQDSTLTKDPEGKMPLAENIKKYISYRLKDNKADSYQEEQAKLVRVKREIAQLELEKRQNTLLEAADVERVIGGMLASFRSRLLALPSELAPRLDGKTTLEINEVLAEQVDEILSELKDYDPEMFNYDEQETTELSEGS